MTAFTVSLKTVNGQHEGIYLPASLINKLQLEDNQLLPLYFGINNRRIVRVHSHRIKKNEIYITTVLKDNLLLPYSKKLMITPKKDGLQLGPIIGILTTDYNGNKFRTQNVLKENTFSKFFKRLLAPEPAYPAYYFVFTPDNIDWEQRTIDGYFYNSKQKNNWELITVPFPDVVYNRVPNRTTEKSESIYHFKREYLRDGGQLFNPDFFGKWEMYQILTNDQSTKKFIPETYLNPRLATMETMIKKYPLIYLKPTNGSLGLGIYKIKKENNGYVLNYRSGSYNKSLNFKNGTAIYNYIFTNKRPQRYLIQQGIDLIEFQQKPVDFRIHLNKNQHNNWEITAIGSKVAGTGSVTTHLRTGGKLIDSMQYLESVFKKQAPVINNAIKQSSIQIAKTVEKKIDGPVGELGLDIGIDKNHRIWLFEVNSKPGRSIFKHPGLKSASLESSKRLLEYAIYLSKFNNNNSS